MESKKDGAETFSIATLRRMTLNRMISHSALSVKQRCSSNYFIVINDNSEKVAMCFYV